MTDITCAEMHTMCIVDKKVYAWGGTLHKKLGGKDNRPGPIRSLLNQNVIGIDCGRWHSAALLGMNNNLSFLIVLVRNRRNFHLGWRWDSV